MKCGWLGETGLRSYLVDLVSVDVAVKLGVEVVQHTHHFHRRAP